MPDETENVDKLFPGRAETGPMQFGADWRGVFIRGDDAIGYWIHLRNALKGFPEGIGSVEGLESVEEALAFGLLGSLANILYSANESNLPGWPPRVEEGVQHMRPFEEAKIPPRDLEVEKTLRKRIAALRAALVSVVDKTDEDATGAALALRADNQARDEAF